ncbi:MAG: endopeptidase La [Deltaproteobacteria bacterium]|nr:MAG: endopeptidase La [Deltaproteobacteria bacterium]
MVVTTGMLQPMPVGRSSSVRAITRHVDEGIPLVLVPQIDPEQEDALGAELARVGVLAHVVRLAELPDGTARVLVEGGPRVRVGKVFLEDGATAAQITMLDPDNSDPLEVAAIAQELASLSQQWLFGSGITGPDAGMLVADTEDPDRLGDQVASRLPLSVEDRIELLQLGSRKERLLRIIDHLSVSLAGQQVGRDIQDKVQRAMDESQREYHLREQLKAIREELGDKLGGEAEADAFVERIEASGMPEEAQVEALREVERLRRTHTDAAEYSITRTWLEALVEIPWSTTTDDEPDLAHASAVLDEDHHGLERVKERILEYLAVRQLKPDSKGPVLCFVGPPGVGKTSLGRSIARALGRSFGRIALGGVRDETEIRGHRRTYVGAMPGRIVRALSRAGTKNPVLVLDELDKLGADFRGDPASALLEVLDPAQNHQFSDHYLDLPVDLSQVLFIATANLVDPIPPALADRLELIEIPGYTEEEKTQIANRFLIPRQAEQTGLTDDQLQITRGALSAIINDHTREAGVRELSRQLEKVHRKVARRIVEGRSRGVRITESNLSRYLGKPRYFHELAEESDQPGVVIGLAWTPSGGDILFVEGARMEGKAGLKLTGSLGTVMKESAEAAMSWLRAHADEYGLTREDFDAEYHLHVPAGAIPKDGPSAGVSMLTALASRATGRPVKSHLAMTGEITLRGRVLPVGGVKEKVLAARRAGVREVILPAHNAPDLDDIPKSVRKELTIHFVSRNTEVLELALR